MLVCKTETWMEHRGGFTYSIEKGCVSMNNAQKIRSMTDEELAELIDRETNSCAPNGDCEKMSKDCKACWLDWLQQPAE